MFSSASPCANTKVKSKNVIATISRKLHKLSKMALTMIVQCVVVSENCAKVGQKVAKMALNRFCALKYRARGPKSQKGSHKFVVLSPYSNYTQNVGNRPSRSTCENSQTWAKSQLWGSLAPNQGISGHMLF